MKVFFFKNEINFYKRFKLIKKRTHNNGLALNISNEVYQSDEGICYENVGIPPNKEINYPTNAMFFIAKLKPRIKSGDMAIEMVYKLIEKETTANSCFELAGI